MEVGCEARPWCTLVECIDTAVRRLVRATRHAACSDGTDGVAPSAKTVAPSAKTVAPLANLALV